MSNRSASKYSKKRSKKTTELSEQEIISHYIEETFQEQQNKQHGHLNSDANNNNVDGNNNYINTKKLLSVKSLKSPSTHTTKPFPSATEKVKEGFIKVTVSSGPNEVNHFSRSLSCEDLTDDEIFEDVSSVENENEAVEDHQDKDIYSTESEIHRDRSFEEFSGDEGDMGKVRFEIDATDGPKHNKKKTLKIDLKPPSTNNSPRGNLSNAKHSTYPSHLPVGISIAEGSQDSRNIQVIVSPNQHPDRHKGFKPVHKNEANSLYYEQEMSIRQPKQIHSESSNEDIYYIDGDNQSRNIGLSITQAPTIQKRMLVRRNSLPEGMNDEEFRKQTDLQLRRQKEMVDMYQQRTRRQQEERQRRTSEQEKYHQQQLLKHQQYLQRIQKQQQQNAKQQEGNRNNKVVLNGTIMRRHSFDNIAQIERNDEEHLREIYKQELQIQRQTQQEKHQNLQQLQQQQHQQIHQQKKAQLNKQETSERRVSYENEIRKLEEQIQMLEKKDSQIENFTSKKQQMKLSDHQKQHNKVPKFPIPDNTQHKEKQIISQNLQNFSQHQQLMSKQTAQSKQLRQQQQQRRHEEVKIFNITNNDFETQSVSNTPLHNRKFKFYDDQLISLSANNTPSTTRKRGKIPSRIRKNSFSSEDIINHESMNYTDRRASNPNVILGRTDINQPTSAGNTHAQTLPRSFGREKKKNKYYNVVDNGFGMKRSNSTLTADNLEAIEMWRRQNSITRPNSTTILDEYRINRPENEIKKGRSIATHQFTTINTHQHQQQNADPQQQLLQHQQFQIQLLQQQQQQLQQQLLKQQHHQEQKIIQQKIQTLKQKQQKLQHMKKAEEQQDIQKAVHQHKVSQTIFNGLRRHREQEELNARQNKIEQKEFNARRKNEQDVHSYKFQSQNNGLNIINGSHVSHENGSRVMKKSTAFHKLYQNKPALVKKVAKPKQISPRYDDNTYQSIKVKAKRGEISLIHDKVESGIVFSDRLKQDLAYSMYGKYEDYVQQHENDSSFDGYVNTSSKKGVGITNVGNDEETEAVFYTVCTFYFKPENNDGVQSIHRMGKARVPKKKRHADQCVFLNNCFNPDKEEIVVRKLLIPMQKNCKKINTASIYNTGAKNTDYEVELTLQKQLQQQQNMEAGYKHQSWVDQAFNSVIDVDFQDQNGGRLTVDVTDNDSSSFLDRGLDTQSVDSLWGREYTERISLNTLL